MNRIVMVLMLFVVTSPSYSEDSADVRNRMQKLKNVKTKIQKLEEIKVRKQEGDRFKREVQEKRVATLTTELNALRVKKLANIDAGIMIRKLESDTVEQIGQLRTRLNNLDKADLKRDTEIGDQLRKMAIINKKLSRINR